MEENRSCSDDSGTSEQGMVDSVIQCLDMFKVRVSEFSQPNLAKPLGESTELADFQEKLLQSIQEFSKNPYITHENFISVVQDTADIRSFRVLFGQRSGSLYDYALMCVDIYFHSFTKPSVVLRTGFGEVNLSLYFSEDGSLTNMWILDNILVEVGSSFLERFFYELHSVLFIYAHNYTPKLLAYISGKPQASDQTEETKQEYPEICEYSEKSIPPEEITAQQDFLKYACIKYGILEHLKNPLPELAEAISAYFIIYKQNLKMHLEINSVIEGMVVKFNDSTLTYKKNPKIMKFFDENGYNEVQSLLYSEVRKILDDLPSPKEKFDIDYGNTAPVVLTEATQNDPQPPESSTMYFQALKELRFSTADFWSKKKHVLLENITNEGTVNTNRLGKEVKVLSQHLPCEMTGGIFVVMDSERMDLMKALISGTEDTPYTHGLYEFHIACPAEYPKKPPLVSIVTTGNGKVRFNPNLYDDGYVCLSVINTWDGDPSERWNPAHSNILQVLLSIQVLVMDGMIIQKEPEFEHLTEDSWENKLYCNIVRYNNVKYAMLGMLENPPEEFKEIIWRHFSLKRNAIMRTVDKWLEEGKDFVIPNDGDIDYLVMDHNPHTCTLFKSYSYYSILLEARNDLLKKLDSLPTLGIPKEEFSIIEITEDMAKLGGYYKKMNSFMLVEKELSEAGGYRHQLGMHLSSHSKYRSKREAYAKETEHFSQIKCLPNSTVFIVRDSERWDLMKILISGPFGTDYANGLFLFDVACPEDYPDSPPKVFLVTNGRFTVSFHPRLQANGEILGLTWWSGATLADYFLQIQDIFKQPVWTENIPAHTSIIRYNTLRYAILDMIEHPPADFKAVVAAHFEMKKRDVLLLAENWIDESTNVGDFKENTEDNLGTVEVFTDLGVSAAIESVYSEIVEVIGGVVGEDWSECSDKEEKEVKKPKKTSSIGDKKSYSHSCSDCESSSLDS
ncbi:hypothetical protein SteCoe_12761 [Stentor coeruleus]|uniref:Ubiquitin-conjugating enzyme E2 Z n=1 Tax=Stentor coeruleus TaxID=5963 RepID=A0A1R2CA13_9CILI|nr:hypothetical protein SteCoe_12761 [Stentor coeruleus]